MKARTTNKKSSAKKKLIPAAGSLMISAVMLSTSTYAWFTMSREVEVKGIQMTATVPQNIQISLGNNMSTGYLSATTDNTTKRLTSVIIPGNADADPDWANSVVVSDFYEFGKLTPATSATGLDIWYTKDATGNGRTLKGQEIGADGKPKNIGSAESPSFGTISATFQNATATDTTLSAATLVKTSSKGTMASGDDIYSNGGAYYIDIPVWFRSSADSTVNLGVKATVSIADDARTGFTVNSEGNRSDSDRDTDLYKAVRVSILKGTDSGAGDMDTATIKGTANTTQGVIYDATITANSPSSKYYSEDTAYKRPDASGFTGTAGTDTTARTVSAVDGSNVPTTWTAISKITECDGTVDADGFAQYTEGSTAHNADATQIVTIPTTKTQSQSEYSDGVRYTMRVWIDGEDVNCWNATAAQNFLIGLNFYQLTTGNDANTGI